MSVAIDPFMQFQNWLEEATRAGEPQPDAMALATIGENQHPSVRMVLFKGLKRESFYFFTNYESRKAKELETNPFAAISFYWFRTQKQIRIEGRVEKTSAQESDEYWATRPRESQLAGSASPQSRPIVHDDLQKKVRELEIQFQGKNIPRPADWGGYRLIPSSIEFWSGRSFRLHEREVFQRDGDIWTRTALAP